ncbi:hypothetical protein HGA13_17110 [Nocardia speluncae]|uniref:Uncharacterized protein n=1 Tax=Nocardia speluncae TaxID=419477 RepID=A0A846XEG3_9NOCA|nr:hypothetical protein [Nocardia speluncae]NKY34781.1 hypothetical protein [Nocardia speluncae]
MADDYDDTADDFDDAPEVKSTPAPQIHEVFNPDHTVGVACGRDGEVVGMHITDDAKENGEVWLSAEILKVAGLAHAKSRLGLRREMEANGARAYTVDSFGLPTEGMYRAMENEAFGLRPA